MSCQRATIPEVVLRLPHVAPDIVVVEPEAVQGVDIVGVDPKSEKQRALLVLWGSAGTGK